MYIIKEIMILRRIAKNFRTIQYSVRHIDTENKASGVVNMEHNRGSIRDYQKIKDKT